MKTIRIVNGDIFIDEGTGGLELLEGIEKGSQDVARHLLCELNTTFNEGNELLNLTFDGGAMSFSEALAQQFLYESMSRLILKQRNANSPDRITRVNQIKTRTVGLSTLVFLVEVLFSNGQTASVVDQFSARPVQLDQLLPASATVGI